MLKQSMQNRINYIYHNSTILKCSTTDPAIIYDLSQVMHYLIISTLTTVEGHSHDHIIAQTLAGEQSVSRCVYKQFIYSLNLKLLVSQVENYEHL